MPWCNKVSTPFPATTPRPSIQPPTHRPAGIPTKMEADHAKVCTVLHFGIGHRALRFCDVGPINFADNPIHLLPDAIDHSPVGDVAARPELPSAPRSFRA